MDDLHTIPAALRLAGETAGTKKPAEAGLFFIIS